MRWRKTRRRGPLKRLHSVPSHPAVNGVPETCPPPPYTHTQVTSHWSPQPQNSSYPDSTNFQTSTRVGSSALSLPAARGIFATWDLPEAAGRPGWLEAAAFAGPADRVWAGLHLFSRRTFYSERQVPPGPTSSLKAWNREATTSEPEIQTPRKKKVGEGENTHSDTRFSLPLLCLANAGSAEMNIPTQCRLPLSVDRTHLQGLSCSCNADGCVFLSRRHLNLSSAVAHSRSAESWYVLDYGWKDVYVYILMDILFSEENKYILLVFPGPILDYPKQ